MIVYRSPIGEMTVNVKAVNGLALPLCWDNELHRNAYSSIHCSFEFDSNVIDASELQLAKQDSHKISILDSITTAFD
jgi:hypothetical protein